MTLRETRMRQMFGSLALLVVLLQATGCTGYVEGPGISIGYTMEYTVDTGIGSLFTIDNRVDRPLAAGMTVAVAFAAHGVIAIPAAGG